MFIVQKLSFDIGHCKNNGHDANYIVGLKKMGQEKKRDDRACGITVSGYKNNYKYQYKQ